MQADDVPMQERMPASQACYHCQAEFGIDLQQQRLHSLAQKSAAKLAMGTSSGQVMASFASTCLPVQQHNLVSL